MTEIGDSQKRQNLLREIDKVVEIWKKHSADFKLDFDLSTLDDSELENLLKDLHAQFGKAIIDKDVSFIPTDMQRRPIRDSSHPTGTSAVADELPQDGKKTLQAINIDAPPTDILKPSQIYSYFKSHPEATVAEAEKNFARYLTWVETNGTKEQLDEAKSRVEAHRSYVLETDKQREEKKRQAALAAAVPAGQTSSAASIIGLKDQKETPVVFYRDSRVAILALLLIAGLVGYWFYQHPSDGRAAPSDGSNTAVTSNGGNQSSGGSTNVVNKTTQNQQATCPGDHEMKSGETYDVPAGCNVKGDVEVATSNGSKSAHKSNATEGNILSCPDGCKITATFDGANVSPRTVPDLFNEMKGSGCAGGKGCATVTCWMMTGGNLSQLATCPSSGSDTGKAAPGNTPSATPSVQQPMNDSCEPELKMGDKRVIKKGCIVVGDVLVRPAGSSQDFRPVYDNHQKTGTVQLLSEDTEVWNVQGASVMSQDSDFNSIVMATKIGGCGTGYGCPDGIFDWSGKRLDQ